MADQGINTTEFAMAKEASKDWLSIAVSVIGLLVGIATLVLDNVPAGGIVAVVAAAVVAFGNRFAKVMNAVGYGKTRQAAKEAQAALEVAKIEAADVRTSQEGA